MGRQKGRHLNMVAKKLLEIHPELFSTDFNENKVQVGKLGILKDARQERNKLAGGITKRVKQMREEEAEELENRAPRPTHAPMPAAA